MKAVPHATIDRLFADSPYLLAICSQEGKFRWSNPSWARLTGRPKHSLKGLTALDLIHPDDREAFSSALRTPRTYSTKPFGARVVTVDGRSLCMEWHVVKLHGSPNTHSVHIFAHDASPLANAEIRSAHTRAELQELQSAIDHTAIVTITDPQGNIIYANRKFCDASQYLPEEVMGKNHRFFNSGYHPKSFFDDLWKTVSEGRVWKGEIRNRRKDDSYYWVDTTIIPFLDEQRVPYKFMSIRTDITERKKNEGQLALEHARRVYLGRLAAVGEVAAGIGHEINNPLAAILMNAQLIRKLHTEGRLKSNQFMEMIERIEKTSRRIEAIVHSLKTLSRNGDGDPLQRTSLQSITHDTLELCNSRFERAKIRLQIEIISPEAQLECRPVQISQVLLNLLNNAFDAVSESKDKWVRLELKEIGESVEIAVSDGGPGVPPDLHKKIMQPFFTTKEVGKGTGLGLSISRGIAERHKGSLFLDTDSSFTRFVLRLPKEPSKYPSKPRDRIHPH